MKKPTSICPRPSASVQPGAESWIAAGAEQPAVPAIKSKNNNPRRMTIDMSDELHKSIKLASVESGCSMVDLVRDVLANHFLKDE